MKLSKKSVLLAVFTGLLCGNALAEVKEVRISKQFGLGFLPLMVMQDQKLIEKHAKAAGLGDVEGKFLTLSTPAAMNDALLSGQIDFGTNGPPSILTIWSKTKGTRNEIKGAAGMIVLPMWLNTNNPNIKSIKDFTDKDKIAITSVKVSIPAIILQMAAAKEWGKANYAKLDPLTVSMSHPNGYAALLTKRDITAHFTSPPYMQLELQHKGIHRVMSSDDVMGGKTTFSMLYSSSRFHDANPRTYKVVLDAFTDAINMINKDKKAAVAIYMKVSGDKVNTPADILKLIDDPDYLYTTTPYHIQKYADFMYSVGSIANKPASWKDVFFPEVHDLPGS